MDLRPPRGTLDLLPPEGSRMRAVYDRAAALARLRRSATEATMHVESRQERDREAAGLGGGEAAQPHLGRIAIRGAVGLVMEVVKLPDRSEARLRHLFKRGVLQAALGQAEAEDGFILHSTFAVPASPVRGKISSPNPSRA